MTTAQELQDELQRHLAGLHKDISEKRQKAVGPNEIQRTTDRFLIDWSERLFTELPSLVANEREAILRQKNERFEPGETFADLKKRNPSVMIALDKSEEAIINHVNQVRAGMTEAVRDILKGRESSLTMTIEPKVVNEKVLTRADEFEARIRAGELTPERVRQMKALIAKTRDNAQNQNPDTDMET